MSIYLFRAVAYADVETFFADPAAEGCETFDSTDADHGRIEQRHHVVRHNVDWLFSDRRYADEPRFPHLAMIGMVQSHTQRSGKIEQERRYYLCSTRLSAEDFARAVRAHWGVENRLHWVLDVIFHDDLARLRSGFGPENMAVVKHMAMNLLRSQKDRHSLKSRRKLACLNEDYLHALVAQKPPLT